VKYSFLFPLVKKNIKIDKEMRELQSKIKWQLFFGHGVYTMSQKWTSTFPFIILPMPNVCRLSKFIHLLIQQKHLSCFLPPWMTLNGEMAVMLHYFFIIHGCAVFLAIAEILVSNLHCWRVSRVFWALAQLSCQCNMGILAYGTWHW